MLAKLQWFGFFLRAREINFRRKCENQTIKCSVLNHNEDKELKEKRRRKERRRHRGEAGEKTKNRKGEKRI